MVELFRFCCLVLFFTSIKKTNGTVKRSIDASAAYTVLTEDRLPNDISPQSYDIHLEPNYDELSFSGLIKMNLSWNSDSKKVWFHAHYDLNINDRKIRLSEINGVQPAKNYTIIRGGRQPKKTIYVLYLKETVKQNTQCTLEVPFEGTIWKTAEGLFRNTYKNYTYFVTNLKPTNARRLFPCFDEPGIKVPFTVSITRPKEFITISNTAVSETRKHPTLSNLMIDYFEKTPPMSPFNFGFVISTFKKWNLEELKKLSNTPSIQMWSYSENTNIKEIYDRLIIAYKKIEEYVGIAIPLTKIDVVIIPDLAIVRPIDNFGLLIFKDSDILKQRYFDSAQELIYQWLGSWVTPEWWSDAHVNKALTSFLAAEVVIQIDGGIEFNGKYPITALYSMYYEFSKRYPHSRITGMKHETIAYKTEMAIRMLNFTLSKETFQRAIQNFIMQHQYKTFVEDDLWSALTIQALKDKTLREQYSVSDIIRPWLRNHRLPVVNVERNYQKNSVVLRQKMYLRERPHDVPGQDKMLWWIPIVLNHQDTLRFCNYTPSVWMEESQNITIENMPGKNSFIIVNPEEIGPFPVNYDQTNWNLLANFLQTKKGRTAIPANTRAKLLHDAWNLAYAGNLSFATTFNMTLFMKSERDHIVWNSVFTFIDQIGRHIDVSIVHRQFERYVSVLLSPLYEELKEETEYIDSGKAELRALAKRFLCRAGYKPCIDVAQAAYKDWQQTANPDMENPMPKNYICPVFKWGTMEEWIFGLQRVIQFPKSRIASERTFLLKSLAGCPTQPEKINRLLELTVLNNTDYFSENDVFLILTTLTGGSSGYYTLFNFLNYNWIPIKQKFKNQTNIWDHLIGSATGFFTTQEGYDMVQNLYKTHHGEFGSAQHIIEKSIRNIKEEAQWSQANLPVIEAWLNKYFTKNTDTI
ncbi:aminopeptidase N isoform X1 [Drosophila busckii]|uniref:aminopeptidase N isoform X1 n=1 Tax=Drosophila busckii TaxID=30019 RepID=UPI00083F4BB3|nr:aminopeptidase N isoform X1 [Drosophila busckii]